MDNKLESIRIEIDKIDRELSSLLEKRMELVSQVADYKRKTGIKVLDANREKKVIENALSGVADPAYKETIRATFEDILRHSREFQQRMPIEPCKGTKKYALIGERLSHSLSPEIHRVFFEKTGVRGSYELIEVPQNWISGILDQLREEGYSGINVTIPYKTDVMRSLDVLSDEVLKIGAVNTITLGKEKTGYNTDYFGFGKSLEYYGVSIEGKKCAVLGSGGSSRAVVAWLEDHGAAQIVIVTRDTDSISLKYPGLSSVLIGEFQGEGFDLIVNTTPIGMWPKTEASPLRKDQLNGAGFVLDIIYNPDETLLMKYSKESGIPCANGLFMLVAQAVCAQEIWQGFKADRNLIIDIYKELKKW